MEKNEFSMVLEGNLLEEWVGIQMVIIVLDSLILWDHSYPSNYLILSYILREFSWKRLSNIHWRIGERLCEGLSLNRSLETLASLSRGFDLLHTRIEQVCMLEPRATKRELVTSRRSSCNVLLSINMIQWHVSFP
jgi:hypothetical protein